MNDFSALGENLKAIRDKRGLNLNDVSELTGISKAMLSKIERGESVPTITTVWKIANGLKITLNALAGDGENNYTVKDIATMTPLIDEGGLFSLCSATSFLRNWDSILEKKRANLRSISEPARLRQPPPRSTGAAHARGRAQSIREERRIAAPPVLFALLWVRLLPALYGPFCGPLRPFGGCPWGVTPPARECLPPAPPDTRRRG